MTVCHEVGYGWVVVIDISSINRETLIIHNQNILGKKKKIKMKTVQQQKKNSINSSE